MPETGPYYGQPDEIPDKLEDLTAEELEIRLLSSESYANDSEKSGNPDDLSVFSFPAM